PSRGYPAAARRLHHSGNARVRRTFQGHLARPRQRVPAGRNGRRIRSRSMNMSQMSSAGMSPDQAHAKAALEEELASYSRRAERAATLHKVRIAAWQLVLLVILLAAWELLTRVPWLVKNTIFDPFFLSRPSLIAVNLYEWTLG